MRRTSGRGSLGQAQMEYLGLILVIAAVVAALVAAPVIQQLPDMFRAVVCQIFGRGDCGGLPPNARPNEYYQPNNCLVSHTRTEHGGSISVVATVGKDIVLVKKVMSDGETRITAARRTTAGIEVGVGGDVQVAKIVEGAAEANIGAEIKGTTGNTWVFDNERKADGFVDDIETQNTIDAAKETGPVGWLGGTIYDAVDDSDPPEPHIDRYKLGLDAYGDAGVNGGFGFGGGSGSSGGSGNSGSGDSESNGASVTAAGVGVEGKIGGDAEVAVNHRKGTVTTTFQFNAGGSAGANVFGHESINDVPIKGRGSVKGNIKVTTKDGEITRVRFQSARSVNNELKMTTTRLEVDNEHDRRVVERFLARSMQTAGPEAGTVPWVNPSPTSKPGEDALPMQRLLYEEGKVTQAQYRTRRDPWEVGGDVKVGVKLGIEGHTLTEEKDLVSASYLGSPRDGTRSFVTYEDCQG